MTKSKSTRAARRTAYLSEAPKPLEPLEISERFYRIASRFLEAQNVIDVVIQNLLNDAEEGLNAELATTLKFARDYMDAAHNDLDLLSGQILREQVRS